MHRHFRLFFGLFVVVLLSHSTARGSLTLFTDRTAWENAIGGVIVTEDFNPVTPFEFTKIGPNIAGVLDFTVGGAIDGRNEIRNGNPSASIPVDVNGTTYYHGEADPGSNSSIPVMIFPTNVIGFGADWNIPDCLARTFLI